jgi:DNA-binding MarR family transcriptional regulator
MVRQGLVDKIRSTADARRYNVVITEKGRTHYRSTTRNSITQIFSGLTEANKRGLDKGLEKLLVKAYKVLGRKYQSNVLSE